ncbi:MAG TPA: hypothetical protein VJN18_26410 [Polyangiaceae bacterium]|nr:hypothetical protein [Polyangiaceae bacterium]
MTAFFASVSVLSLWALVLGGCEVTDCKTEEGKDATCAESLKVHEGESQSESVPYAVGQNVTIQGIYGDIFVTGGDEAEVAAIFKPFNYRGHDQDVEAERELAENLDLAVVSDADGITISASRHDAANGLGSHITVALPPEFNGVLFVQNDGDGPINQGNIDVSYVGEATTLNVVNHGLENCNILRPEGRDDELLEASTLTDTDVRCGADIYVRGVSDNVYVDSRDPAFHSDVVVEIMSISANATGGEIKGADSDVRVFFPDAGDYSISASAGDNGAHIGTVVAGSCEETGSDETSAELTCGAGGPVYQVFANDADPDDESSFVDVRVEL